MTTQIPPITERQLDIITRAMETDGLVLPHIDVKGGARIKVIEAMMKRNLVEEVEAQPGDPVWRTHNHQPDGNPLTLVITAHARELVAQMNPTASEIEAEVAAVEAAWVQDRQAAAQRLIQVGVEGKPRTRENSKQALVLALLGRPEGATIAQIMEATGWQAHTVRGTFAGAFKKKLGLDLVSEKSQAGRVYRINQAA